MIAIRHTKKPCDHRGPAFGYDYFDGARGVLVEQIRCICGELLPIGPARDDGPHAEQVAIEIEAARVARDFRVAALIMSCPEDMLTSPVGQLVRAIWEHDGTPEAARDRIAQRRANARRDQEQKS